MHAAAEPSAANAFIFFEYFLMPRPTGKRATSLQELLKFLRKMSETVLKYHLWESRLATHPPVLEYPNDFALWAANALHNDKLAEKLSSIDPFEYDNLTQVRKALADLVEEYLGKAPQTHQVLPGFEFYFCEGSAVVMRSGIVAQTLRQFCGALRTVGLDSIYYHFVEARWRLGDRKMDDFSRWIEGNFALPALVSAIRDIDVYFYTPVEVRDTVLNLIMQHAEETCGPVE